VLATHDGAAHEYQADGEAGVGVFWRRTQVCQVRVS
jgi:hypothetical protein